MYEPPLLTHPDSRVSIVDQTVALVEWNPRLRPTQFLQPTNGASCRYADLRFLGTPGFREAIVTHDLPEALDSAASDALAQWGAKVGLARLWMPDQLLDLGEPVDPDRVAVVTCPLCRATITASGLEFWLGVRASGTFPARCARCGGSLPQWQCGARSVGEEL